MKERRLNIRVDPDVFDKLNDKRHGLRTTFQAIGQELLAEWLDGDQTKRLKLPKMSDEDRRLVDQILALIKKGDKEVLPIVRMLLKKKG